MKCYNMVRKEDVSGNSGTGKVAEVCEFEDGTCALHWSGNSNALGVTSTVIYNSKEDVEKVHGHGGLTYLELVYDTRFWAGDFNKLISQLGDLE